MAGSRDHLPVFGPACQPPSCAMAACAIHIPTAVPHHRRVRQICRWPVRHGTRHVCSGTRCSGSTGSRQVRPWRICPGSRQPRPRQICPGLVKDRSRQGGSRPRHYGRGSRSLHDGRLFHDGRFLHHGRHNYCCECKPTATTTELCAKLLQGMYAFVVVYA